MKIKSEVCGMTKKQKRMLVRIIISFVLFAALMVAEHTGSLDHSATTLSAAVRYA